MSFLKKVGNAISKPVRGIGRIARGNVRAGLRDLGDTAKLAAPVLAATGVGLPLAAGIGAVGGALGAKSGASAGDVVRGAAQGAGGAAVGAGVGKLVSGGLPGLSGLPGMGGAAGAAGAAPGAAPGAGGALAGIGKVAKGLGGWIAKNPDTATAIAGAGASAYGAKKEGDALDRRAGLDEEMLRFQMEQARLAAERQARFDPLREQLMQKLMAPKPSFNEWRGQQGG